MPLTIVLILGILFALYGNLKFPLIIMFSVLITVPVGGLLALKLTDTNFSVSSGFGFVALMGVAVQTSVILYSFINKLRREGRDIVTATYDASLLRLRPIIMTALVACLGLLPAAMSTGHRQRLPEALRDRHRRRTGLAPPDLDLPRPRVVRARGAGEGRARSLTRPRGHAGRGLRMRRAILTAAAIILSSPWIGEARSWLRRAIPGQFVLTLNIALGVIAIAALAIAVARIRDRRAMRYAALAAAAGLAAFVALDTASASGAQNAVERFHFVEYGADHRALLSCVARAR